ncbi:ABC transporter permease [Lysinibacillus xylanilyticus]|uniref:ABC transporter permease n=1 Tax=Lysinibacillus xylanilyticus TaxID=582475 RepID=UPI003D027DB3
MLLNSFRCELLKLKRSKIWIVMTLLPLFCITLGLINFRVNYDVLMDSSTNEWEQAWTQVGLIYGLFLFPVIVSIYCAFVCRFEHSEGNWKKIISLPIPFRNVYLAKLLVIFLLTFLTQIFFLFAYIVIGKLLGITSPIPWFSLLNWSFNGWIGTFSIAALQLSLSSSIKSFAVPVGMSFGFTCIGMIFHYLNIPYIWPFAQPGFAMDPIHLEGLQTFLQFSGFYMLSFLFVMIFTFIGVRRFTIKDII